MANGKPDVSFIGLGAMGFGMATNLVKQGYKVTGFDVWLPTLERFKAAGGSTGTTPAEAVAGKDFCVCMVATAQQAQAVLVDGENPALPALPKGAALLLCSTVPCAYVQSLEKQLAELGRGDIRLIDAPVSGGAARAADGTLSIMAGASDDAIEAGRFLLQEMSDPKKLYIVKGGVGAGSNMKMCHQVLAANQILAASEGLGFASHLGLDLHAASQAILKSEAWAWMFENRLPRMLDPEFKPVASALTIILKDTSIITSEARRAGFPTPMASTAEQVYFAGLGRGYGPDDDSSLIRLYTEGKGKIGPVQGAASADAAKLSLVIALLKGIYLCSAAEALAFAHRCRLDLDQVFDLCINAAGGSAPLQDVGPDIIRFLRGEPLPATAGGEGLGELAQQLQEAVEEAQRLKAPVFLGSEALSLTRFALRLAPPGAGNVSKAAVVRAWGL
ncbi:NAD binding domain of 6-phosphogluconate dehydrogenase-domain-containing protein [Durotheca rogersii]|uniref:NAD binding domain of 6-phosphogluconate dehydrogenase-domain-containing protein n=1 Tax=Durotheca rogersii TaxID=419775 RepID=UPI00221E56DF|nr:NAD binding domain of 6-phosphogluconate dehydrogenase-domain-containing protein [Durotheca rogersii]KAI5860877.1 NAD binding domain of 6-phosphogluconate dehydrogenase-domain-containing protein [Durotheca rogersii]